MLNPTYSDVLEEFVWISSIDEMPINYYVDIIEL